MLGFLMTLFCGTIALKEDWKRNQSEIQSKFASEYKGDVGYWGFNSKGKPVRKATETDEIMSLVAKDGRLQYIGVYSNRVYYDITQEKLNRQNEMLKSQGKKFHYQYFPKFKNWKDPYGNNAPLRVTVENSTGKPFKLVDNLCEPFTKELATTATIYYYYDFEDQDIESTSPKVNYDDSREISKEEAKLYQ